MAQIVHSKHLLYCMVMVLYYFKIAFRSDVITKTRRSKVHWQILEYSIVQKVAE